MRNRIPVDKPCARCGGTGKLATGCCRECYNPQPFTYTICMQCHGTGIIKDWIEPYAEELC